MARVSIVVPCYNHAKYVGDAIESILKQTYSDFEVFVFDNGSKDNSWSVIQQYEDPRLTKIRLKNNDLLEVKRRFCEMASGEYCAILYSDDVWEVTKLEKQVGFMDKNLQAEICFTWANQVDENLCVLEEKYIDHTSYHNKSQKEWIMDFLLNSNSISCPSVLMTKALYEEFFVKLYPYRQIADMFCWLKIVQKTNLYVVEEILVHQRIHCFGDNPNESARTTENLVRECVELKFLSYQIIDEMEDDVFVNLISDDVSIESHVDVLCRKFLFIKDRLQNLWYSREMAIMFYYKYFDYTENNTTFYMHLSEKYNFSRQDFFEITGIDGERERALGDRLARWETLERVDFHKFANCNENFIIYGCGSIGKALAKRLHDVCRVQQFIDRHSPEKEYMNIPISSIDNAVIADNSIIIVVPMYDFDKIVLEILEKHNHIDRKNILGFEEFFERYFDIMIHK